MPTSTLPQAYVIHGTKRSPEREDLFIEELRRGGSPRTAAIAAGVGRATVFNWKREDPEFAARWNEAVEEGYDKLEEEARRRAYDGVVKPVFQGGARVGEVTEYSDQLMMFILRGRRPNVYNADKLEVKSSVNVTGDVTHIHGKMTPQQAIEAYSQALTAEPGAFIEHDPTEPIKREERDEDSGVE